MVVRCYILGVESTLDAITIFNDWQRRQFELPELSWSEAGQEKDVADGWLWEQLYFCKWRKKISLLLGFIWLSGAHVSVWLWLTVFTTAVGGKWLQQFVFQAISYFQANYGNNRTVHGCPTSKVHHAQPCGHNETQHIKYFLCSDNFRSSDQSKGSACCIYIQTSRKFLLFLMLGANMLKVFTTATKVEPLYLCCKQIFQWLATAVNVYKPTADNYRVCTAS